MNIVDAMRVLEIHSSLNEIDEDDVERSYKNQLINHHPDRFSGNPEKIVWANEHLKRCAVAKDLIMARIIDGVDLENEQPYSTTEEREFHPKEYYIIRIQNSGSKKAWVAKLTGRHPKYQFIREWVDVDRWFGRDDKQYKLQAGWVYEVNEPAKSKRYFVFVQDEGKISFWDKHQVMAYF